MTAVVTARLNGTRFYLTKAGLPTDIQSRANTHRDLTCAALVAAQENTDPCWGELRGMWRPAYVMSDGTVSLPD